MNIAKFIPSLSECFFISGVWALLNTWGDSAIAALEKYICMRPKNRKMVYDLTLNVGKVILFAAHKNGCNAAYLDATSWEYGEMLSKWK